MKGAKRSDGSGHEPAAPEAVRRGTSGPKKKGIGKNASKQITPGRKDGMIYVGLDLHKKTIQIAAVDYRGATLLNKKIRNTHASLEMEISRMPKGSKYVIESSSVWEDVYHYMRNELGLDVVLSDPYKTKLIAESKKKTDKVDALILADMLRGGYISECYVPEGLNG